MAVVEFFSDRDFQPRSGPERLSVPVPREGGFGQRAVQVGQLRARGLNNDITSVRYQLLRAGDQITTILFQKADFGGRFFGVTSRSRELALLPEFIRDRTSAILIIRHAGTELPALPLTAAARPTIHSRLDSRFRRIILRSGGTLVILRRGPARLRAAYLPEFAPTETFLRIDIPLLITVAAVPYTATVTYFIAFSVTGGQVVGAARREGVRVSVRRGVLRAAIETALRRRAGARSTIAQLDQSIADALQPLNNLPRAWRSAYLMPGRPRFPLPPGGYQGRVSDDVSLLVA